MSDRESVLVINSGSSSLKFGLYDRANAVIADGEAETAGGSIEDALASALEQLKSHPAPLAVGHRVVHGGPHLLDHQRITPEVLQTLRDSVHFAPLHIPPALKLIEAAQKAYPGVPQFACFDTVFHKTMPEAACHLPIPQDLWQQGVRRYGFHGLSYESIVHQLGRAVPEKMVVAHLGNGCSVTAILNGQSVDTSMGLTPTGGVVMGTRTGDLDPGVLLYLMRAKGLGADELETLLNKQCGLLALGGASDMRELEKAGAALALEVFYRTTAKTIAGYASVLGGIDLLVFAGGIGEHSARTREEVTRRLGFMQVGEVKVVASEEDLQIARHCWRLMGW